MSIGGLTAKQQPYNIGTMSLTIKIDTTSFNQQLALLQKANGKAGGSCVRYWARKGIKKIAYDTPVDKGVHRNKGRLRAGWWPAAQALGVSTVYSGGFPNKGEGAFVDKTKDQTAPSFTMINTVRFVPFVKNIVQAVSGAMARLEAEARSEFDTLMKRELVNGGASQWF